MNTPIYCYSNQYPEYAERMLAITENVWFWIHAGFSGSGPDNWQII